MMSLDDFLNAQERIREYVEPSLLRYSSWLSEELEAEVYLKLEALQPGRSFKIRGATNALLTPAKLPKQVVTASGGNHGLGVAIACQRMEVPCLVVLPISTSPYRVNLLRRYGAEVELHGDAWDDANYYALTLAQSDDVLYIHPFADQEVMLGQGTIALELEKQIKQYDVLIASVGGGGLLGGISLAIEALGKSNSIALYGVETKGADSLASSLEQDRLVELPAITSIAKTLGAKQTTQFIFENMRRLLEEVFVVEDRDAVGAMYEFLDNEKILVEPAMSCIIPAMRQNKRLFKGKKIVVIVCGSNVSLQEAEDWKEEFGI